MWATLGAVLLYFRGDVSRILSGMIRMASGRFDGPEVRLALLLVIATIPVMIAGLAFKLTGLSLMLRSVTVIAWATLIFGLVGALVGRPHRLQGQNRWRLEHERRNHHGPVAGNRPDPRNIEIRHHHNCGAAPRICPHGCRPPRNG